jgi:hypothetical protein
MRVFFVVFFDWSLFYSLSNREILTAISDIFMKPTYCHLALLYSLIPKQFLFVNFDI